MRMAALAGCALLTMSAAACAIQDRSGLAPAPTSAGFAQALPGQVEPVHAAVIARDQAIFWVTSNGCTAKGDLTPVVAPKDGGSVITVRRLKEDRCQRPQPDGVEVRWTFEELGLAPGARLSVENPAQVRTG